MNRMGRYYFPLAAEDDVVVRRWLSAGGSSAPEAVSAVVGYAFLPPSLTALCNQVAHGLNDGGAWEASLVGRIGRAAGGEDEREVLGEFFSWLLDEVLNKMLASRIRGRRIVKEAATLWREHVTEDDPRWLSVAEAAWYENNYLTYYAASVHRNFVVAGACAVVYTKYFGITWTAQAKKLEEILCRTSTSR